MPKPPDRGRSAAGSRAPGGVFHDPIRSAMPTELGAVSAKPWRA